MKARRWIEHAAACHPPPSPIWPMSVRLEGQSRVKCNLADDRYPSSPGRSACTSVTGQNTESLPFVPPSTPVCTCALLVCATFDTPPPLATHHYHGFLPRMHKTACTPHLFLYQTLIQRFCWCTLVTLGLPPSPPPDHPPMATRAIILLLVASLAVHAAQGAQSR
jgi:hypothetical protein